MTKTAFVELLTVADGYPIQLTREYTLNQLMTILQLFYSGMVVSFPLNGVDGPMVDCHILTLTIE